MRRNRKLWIILPIVLVLCLLAVICYPYYEYNVNMYQMEAHLETDGAQQLSHTEDTIPLHYTVVNSSYIPLFVREVIMVSTYDQAGNPVDLEGYGIFKLSGAGSVFVEGIEANHAVFSTEQTIKKGKSGPQEKDCENARYQVEYLLQATEKTPYTTLQVDVFLMGKPQEYPYAQWELLDHQVLTVDGTEKTEQLPAFNAPTAFSWTLERNQAYLSGIGTVKTENITLPTVVSLRKTEECYVEDPIQGTIYQTVIASDAFYECGSIRSVTFPDGIQVEDNAMHDGIKGMFESCYLLEEVHNIPEGVTSVNGTFKNCTGLKTMPILPESVQSMDYTFYNCTALTEVTELPSNVTVMTDTFRNCVSLEEVCAIPDKVRDMEYCFYGCTALKIAPELLAATVNLKGSFFGCSSLQVAPELPEAATDLTECFKDCIALKEAPKIPGSVSCIKACFENCIAMTGNVEIPSSLLELQITQIIQSALSGCGQVNNVTVETCPNVPKQEFADAIGVPESLIQFTAEHLQQGICNGCNRANGIFNGNGVTVYADNTPACLFIPFLEYVKNEVPAALKEDCSRLTITGNLGKYREEYKEGKWGGFATHPTGKAYVKSFEEDLMTGWDVEFEEHTLIPLIGGIKSITYHELGHCFDYKYTLQRYYSDSAEWIDLYEKERDFLGEYAEYEPHEYLRESFARAVSCYFMEDEEFQKHCPGMYAYLDDLFGNENA